MSNNNQGNMNQQGYPNQQGYANQQGYQGQQGYANQQGYQDQQGYQGQQGYANQQWYQGQQSYQNQQGYQAQQGYSNQQGYAGQQNYQNQQGYANQQNYSGQQNSPYRQSDPYSQQNAQQNYQSQQGYQNQQGYTNQQGYNQQSGGYQQQGYPNQSYGSYVPNNPASGPASPGTKKKSGILPVLLVVFGGIAVVIILVVVIGAISSRKAKDNWVEDSGVSDISVIDNNGDGSSSASSENKMVVEEEHFTFEIDSSWEKYSDDIDMYLPGDTYQQAYGFNGVSNLGNCSEEEFFDSLVSYYEDGGATIEEKSSSLTDKTTVDGDSYKYGYIKTSNSENGMITIAVLLSYDKNLAVTFQAQCAKTDTLKYDLEDITETIRFTDETIDIADSHFIAKDNSEMVFGNDGRFKYYEVAGNYNSSYFDGTYEVCTGREAIAKAASLEQYGLTEEELYNVLEQDMQADVTLGGDALDTFDYLIQSDESETNVVSDDSGETRYHVSLDNFYVIVRQDEKVIMDTGEEIDDDNQILYVGYYIPEVKSFSLTNCSSASYVVWELQE